MNTHQKANYAKNVPLKIWNAPSKKCKINTPLPAWQRFVIQISTMSLNSRSYKTIRTEVTMLYHFFHLSPSHLLSSLPTFSPIPLSFIMQILRINNSAKENDFQFSVLPDFLFAIRKILSRLITFPALFCVILDLFFSYLAVHSRENLSYFQLLAFVLCQVFRILWRKKIAIFKKM